jgi:hypothetical protein
MWWIKDPDRLKGEVSAVDALREQAPWLSAAAPRVSKDLSFVIDFDIVSTANRSLFDFDTRRFSRKRHPR